MVEATGEIRIGVYVCHCGTNIAATLDVAELARYASTLAHVQVARDYKYMCSEPGQELIKEDVARYGLNRVVVAACSPHLHESTFRRVLQEAGLNPYLLAMANIREHVAWTAAAGPVAQARARAQIAAAVARVARQKPLSPRSYPVVPRVLVIGGGIAGIQAALTLAEAGKEVILVEREPTIGGHMAKFDKTFPTLDCAACILTPKMSAVKDHPNIKLLTYSEIQEVTGSVGRFVVKVLRKPRYIRDDLCVGCLQCIEACLFKALKIPNEFDLGLSKRKPIYLPFPQAVPRIPVIDPQTCLRLRTGKCKQTCLEACADRNAIDFEQQEWVEEYEVGAIIVATGFRTFDPASLAYYGYGRFPEVYTALEVERLLNAAGPTGGEVLLRDGAKPRAVGIVHCVGSRDRNTHPYCSRVCCMYAIKLAHLIRERTGAEVFNFYIDIRAPGKGFEEFYERVQKEGVHFMRGKVGEVERLTDNGDSPRLLVTVEDTLVGRVRKIPVDMLVLAVALEPAEGADELQKLLHLSCSSEGFFLEKHPKLAPVNTASDGIFVAGACQGPKDIPDTVAQADAAAAQALALIDHGVVETEPNIAWVNEEVCSGCRVCIALCPFDAITPDEEKQVAVIDPALCKGCGTCVAACPSGAAQQDLFSIAEILAEIEGILSA
ncbi:CoB--CoM heterodisulfide reductase iron-sulfur subunit A family protein [Thermogutta sp.]|uniref:CoB--CoM heterodisulfide reductase iron-sulfur subunit A family protein n=1 Tax=Thermogutta sp. TaxID=1962930 RepID=UPI00321FCAF8